MSKTLAIVLNHNLPEYTTWVYYWLNKFADDSVQVIVMDNGSKPELVSKYAQVKLPKNIFWGGALNVGFRMVLENPDYDSLLFLNNDIEFTPDIFISTLRRAMFDHDLAVVTPCIAGKQQPWRQMQNWGSSLPREVRWIDMQAPLIHRKLIEAIGQFPEALQIGWGQELICYEVCRDRGWKIAVLDHLSMIHYGKQTLMQSKLYAMENEDQREEPVPWEEFKAGALRSRDEWFAMNPLKYEPLEDHVQWGLNYTFSNNPETSSSDKQPEADQPVKSFWGRLFGSR